MSILGNRVVRKEDPAFLTGAGRFVDGLDLGDAVHVTFVRSTVAHAAIRSIDLAEARRAPGVLGVYVDAELGLPAAAPPAYVVGAPPEMRMPFLARDVVRFVGEPVVLIVSEEREQGIDAAEQVVVEYEERPALVDCEQAVRDELLVHPDAGTNVVSRIESERDAALFEGCDVVVKGRFLNQRIAPAPLETRAAAARWTEDGRLTHWASTQSPHMLRAGLARLFGLDERAVHVITADVGGGFGAKSDLWREEALVAWAARQVGRTAKWMETRSESLTGWTHARARVHYAELGGTRDGRILAYRLHVLQDCGAYVHFGALMPNTTRLVGTTVYDIPRVEYSSTSVMTHTAPVGAFRGAGRPEANAAMERAVDLFAAEIGMDPVEVRRRNVIAADAFPFTAPLGSEYDSGDYATALERTCQAADYEALRVEQARRRQAADPKLMGIGVALYVEITAGSSGPEAASVELRPDGSARVLMGRPPQGQGHATMWAMLAHDQLGIPFEAIDVVSGDTDLLDVGGVTGGSSSMQVGGVAVARAAEDLVSRARALAGERLEVDPQDVALDVEAGRFHVVGAPGLGLGWSEIAEAAGSEPLRGEAQYERPKPTFPFGACIAVVEVDRETGGVRLERLVALDDAGRLLNPLLAEGQVHGGLAAGVAQALLEEIQYDEAGNPLTTSFADYLFVSAAELPDFETLHMETPTPHNPLGVKGIGESGTMGATPAVQNAVIDALSHLGVRHVDIPCGPERVWRALQDASSQ